MTDRETGITYPDSGEEYKEMVLDKVDKEVEEIENLEDGEDDSDGLDPIVLGETEQLV